MRVTKSKIAMMVAAVGASLAATQAHAVVDLSVSPITGATYYASEINAAALPGGKLVNAGTNFNLKTSLGVGVSSGQFRYLKITLTNAKWNTAFVAGNVVNATTAFAGQSVALGGATTDNYVIVQVTGAGGNNNIGDVVNITLPDLTITSSAANIGVTYEVYEQLVQAQAGTPVLYSKASTLVNFVPALGWARSGTSLANTLLTTATSGFKNFAIAGGGVTYTNAAAATRGRNGGVALTINAIYGPLGTTTPFLADGTTLATVAAILNAAGNVVNVTGDYSAAATSGVYTTATTCSAANAVDTATVTAGSASFTVGSGTGTLAGLAAYGLCYTLNGTAVVPPSGYTAALVPSAAAGYTVGTLGPVSVGSIIRDGIQLETPWATSTTGYISRIFLTQTTPADVPFTATVRNASGVVTGGTLTGILPSGKMTKIDLATLLPADTTAVPGPYQVTIIANVAEGSVTGSYVLTTPNGAVVSQPLYQQIRQ